MSLVIAEVHLLKPHVPPQRNAGAVRLLPCPADGFPAGGRHRSQADFSLVRLRGLRHHVKHPFRARERRQQEIALLGELIDRRGGLPHEYQIARQAADIGHPVHRHNPAENGHNRIVDIGNADDRRYHRRRKRLCTGPGPAQRLVFGAEGLDIRLLVVKDLYHLLAVHHLFDIAVQISSTGLLSGVIGFAAPAAEADIQKHRRIAHHHDQRQPPV